MPPPPHTPDSEAAYCCTQQTEMGIESDPDSTIEDSSLCGDMAEGFLCHTTLILECHLSGGSVGTDIGIPSVPSENIFVRAFEC